MSNLLGRPLGGDHGDLGGLEDDDHPQYRLASESYTKDQIDILIASVSGGGGTVDHSALDNLAYGESGHTGFSATGHTHYTSDIIGGFVTPSGLNLVSGTLQSQIDQNASDISTHNHNSLYYLESEVDSLLSNKSDTGHSHNDLYYTESEVDTISGALSNEIDSDISTHAGLPNAHHNQEHNNSDHSETYITSTGVTYENLSANSDIGSGATQVAQGDHNHSGTYAPASEGVTNGDSHDHSGGDGAQIDHTTLSNKGTNTHAQIDTHISSNGSDHTYIDQDVTSGASPTLDATNITGGNIHTRLHSITSTSDHSGTAYRTLYIDSAGDVQELTHGTDGYVLTSNGASSNPSWQFKMSDLVDDVTPQLGGNLFTNGNDILFGSDTISGTGTIVTGDHGTSSKPEVVNVVYGTGSEPTASNTTEGTIWLKYTA